MALAFRQLRPSRHSTGDPLRRNGSSESTAQPYHLGQLESLSPPSFELPKKRGLRDRFRHMILPKEHDNSSGYSARNSEAQHSQQSSQVAPSVPAESEIDEGATPSSNSRAIRSVHQHETSPAPGNDIVSKASDARSRQEAVGPRPIQEQSAVSTTNVNHARLVTSFMRVVEDIKMIQIEHSEEFDEPLESQYERAKSGIFEYLCQAQSPLPTGSLQILRGHSMAGSSYRPCIRIVHGDFGNQKKLTNFHIKFSNQRRQYDPPFTICYQSLWDLSSIGNPVSVAWSPSPDSLCGLLASAGSGDQWHQFTLGGLLEVKGSLYAVTAWHERSASIEETPIVSAQSLLEDMVEAGELLDGLDPPLVAARYRDQTEFEEADVESPRPFGLEFLRSAGSISLTGSEWALIHVDNNFLKLPNCVRIDVKSRSPHTDEDTSQTSDTRVKRALRYFTHAQAAADMAQTSTVLVLSGITGEIRATISRKLSVMRLSSGGLVQVWTLSFTGLKVQGLKRGDSGSWVVQPETGAIFGHVVAATHQNAFVLPLDTIMTEIGDCVVPTPFACLAELASTYQKDGDTEMADRFAAKAMEEDVLFISSEANELARLIKARGDRAFESYQTYSSLEPAEIFRYVITKGGSKIPETSEVIRWLTSGETPFWYLALDDIHALLHDLGLNLDFPERKSSDVKLSWPGPNLPGHPFLTFTHVKAALRNAFLDSLTKHERTEIEQELEWIETVRRSMLSEASIVNANEEDDVRICVSEWRTDVTQSTYVQQHVEERLASMQDSRSPKYTSQGNSRMKAKSPIVTPDLEGKTMEFYPANGSAVGGCLTDYAEFPYMAGLRSSDLKGTATHVHLPANSVEWMNLVVRTLGANVSNDGPYWKPLEHGPFLSRQMRPICASVSSRSSFPDLILCIPYLRLEKESSRKRIASWISAEINQRPDSSAQDRHGLSSNGQGSQISSSPNGRRFFPTKLGRLLLNAAALYQAMSLSAEKRLLQTSLIRSEPIHSRRTLYEAYGTPQVNADRNGFTSKSGSGDHEANAIMVDQLWMRIMDGKIVVTSFPNNFGRDLADPTSIYHCVRQRLEEQAEGTNIKAYDIALTVIEECISSFFKQVDKAATTSTITLCGISTIAEEIASVSQKTAYFCKRHRLHLLSETPIPPAIFLQLFDVRQQVGHIIHDLSMIDQLLSEQDNVIEDFMAVAASQPRRFLIDDLSERFGREAEVIRLWDCQSSRYRIETQLLKSMIRRQKCEVSSLIDTTKNLRRRILNLSRVSLDGGGRSEDAGLTWV